MDPDKINCANTFLFKKLNESDKNHVFDALMFLLSNERIDVHMPWPYDNHLRVEVGQHIQEVVLNEVPKND